MSTQADPLPGPPGQFDTLRMADGQALFRRHWPLSGTDRGALLVHGLGEHSGRYRHIAAWLHARGWDVLAYDQRGHGRSAGPRAALRSSDDLLTDLATVYSDYAGRFTAAPLLFGHSLGGLVVARAVLGGLVRPSAMALSSPALRTHESDFMQSLARLLGYVAPGLPLRHGLQKGFVSHDPRVTAFYEDDPLCHHRVTPRLAEFIFRAGASCLVEAARLDVPTLLLAAGDDHLVDASGSREFIASASSDLLSAEIFDGLYHEIFNEAEPARSHVFGRFGAWLGTRFPAR